MDTLATEDDVQASFGRALTQPEKYRLSAVLEKASELFRLEAKQHFTAGVSTVRRKVTAGKAYLPQRPVVSVAHVADDGGADVAWSRVGQWLTVAGCSSEFVTVTYSHGGEVPDLVRLTVADVVRQVLSINPNAAEGVTQFSQTTGPFTEQYTYATWAQGGATRLAPDDVAVARSFRLKVPNLWVQSWK